LKQQGDRQAANDQRQRSVRLLLIFIALMIPAVAGQTWWAIHQDRQLMLSSEAANGMVAVRILEEHATQTLEDAVHTLDQLSASIQLLPSAKKEDANATAPDRNRNESNRIENSINQLIIAAEVRQTRHLKNLQFVNRAGLSWIKIPLVPAYQDDLSERQYIQYLIANQTHRDVLIDHPYPSRYDSQLVIPVARNVYDANDRWLGVISIDLQLSYFGNVYARVAKDNNASVALIANQGFVFVRSPFEARYLDRNISASAVLPRLREGPNEGSFSDDSFLDDEFPRLYTYRKIRNFSITTVYGRDFDTILVPWRDRTKGRIILSGATIGLILCMTFLLQVYINRLRQSRESLRQSEYKFVGLFQHSPVPLILTRQADNRIAEVNDAWLAQFSYQKEQVIGRTAIELNLWVDPTQRASLVRQLALGNSVDYRDVALRHRDGHVCICLISARIFVDGEDAWIIFTVVDVTQQRQIENEIREFNQELEQRVASRTETLEISNQKLSDALASVNVMQEELIRSEKMVALGSLVAGVAHELNTPIGNSVMIASSILDQTNEFSKAISGGALKRSVLNKYVANCAKGMDILMRTLSRAADLVSSFKQVAVDQAGNVRRSFGLNQVLGEVWQMLEPTYKNTPYKLVYNLGPDIEMESYPGALVQVISNFVNNAIMHGFEERDQGTMCISTQALDEKRVQITFTDNGLGVSDDTLKRIFDPFFTTKLGKGGSGLGMHIVYNIVTEVLGGKIDITSKSGAGMTITLVLPCFAPSKLE
jgi:PAS domain S-box-containing protein